MPEGRTGPEYKFNQAQEQRIVTMYTAGSSVKSLARDFHVDEKTVRAALLRNDVSLRGRAGHRKHFLSKAQQKSLVRRYIDGESTESLAEAFGMPPGTVSARLRDLGVELRSPGFQKGEAHHNWAGGKITTSDGYVLVLVYPNDPFYPMAQVKGDGADGSRYVLEHRLVMAQHLGRCLADHETVHHKDLNHGNNTLSNLQLRVGKHGTGASFRCCDCGSYNVEAADL